MQVLRYIRCIAAAAAFAAFVCPSLNAAGKRAIETAAATTGGELWRHDFDVRTRASGRYNILVTAADRAGNEASVPVNVFIDSRAGLPAARVVYPPDGAVIRQDIYVMGIATGGSGVRRVLIRLDDGEPVEASGTEYWQHPISTAALAEGTHTIHAQAFNAQGEAGAESRTVITYDRSAPLLRITSHQIGDRIRGRVTISGIAEDIGTAVGPAAIQYSLNGTDFLPLPLSSRRKGTSAAFSVSVQTKTMPDGPLVLYIRAVDASGLSSTLPCLYIVDNQGPKLRIYTPENGGGVSGAFLLAGSVYDAAGLSRLYYEWKGKTAEIATRPGDPFWAVEVDAGGKGASGILTVTAIDSSGNRSSARVRVRQGTGEAGAETAAPFSEPPHIEFITPAPEQRPVNGSVTVIGTIRPALPITAAAWSRDGEPFTPLPLTSGSGKTWFTCFSNVSTGRLIIRVTGTSGAYTEASPDCVIDAAADIPSLILTSPVENETITTDFTLAGVAFDDDGIAAVYWRLLDERHTADKSAQAAIPFQRIDTGQHVSVPVSFSQLQDGAYTIEAFAEDHYGIRGEPLFRRIRVSSAAPQIRIETPEPGQYNRKTLILQGTASDANGIAAVLVSMNNGLDWQRAALDADGGWKLPLNTAAYRDGVYAALVKTQDAYGVSSTASALVHIDNTPPELRLALPENGRRTGSLLALAGTVQDNAALHSLNMRIIGSGGTREMTLDAPGGQVIAETIDLDGLPEGAYIVRVSARDAAGNESIVSRTIHLGGALPAVIWNPLPGETRSGPLTVSGAVGSAVGGAVSSAVCSAVGGADQGNPAADSRLELLLNGEAAALLTVNSAGVFQYDIPPEALTQAGTLAIALRSISPSGVIPGPRHTIRYSPGGPALSIDSHRDGDVIAGRTLLRGRAWIAPPPGSGEVDRTERRFPERTNIAVSCDNGRTFTAASGNGEWQFPLETGGFPDGALPVLVQAIFANGEQTTRRILLAIDNNAPELTISSPGKDASCRDSIPVYGTAADAAGLAGVDLSLRPGSAFRYSVPGFMHGLYLDAKTFGATWFDLGLGLSFFDGNVRFQFQYGLAPPAAAPEGGRYTGDVLGVKLIANLLRLPLSSCFGSGWEWYSMTLAAGAAFSLFTMDSERPPVYMGALIAQWDIINANLRYFVPRWHYLRSFALYLEPELWFASTDLDADKFIFRTTIGLRWNVF
jgi:hypothetical protein